MLRGAVCGPPPAMRPRSHQSHQRTRVKRASVVAGQDLNLRPPGGGARERERKEEVDLARGPGPVPRRDRAERGQDVRRDKRRRTFERLTTTRVRRRLPGSRRAAAPSCRGEACHLQVLILRPDRERAGEGKGDGRPVLEIVAGHPPLGLLTLGLIDGWRLPVDRHHTERREEETRIEPPSPRQCGHVLGDLLGHRMRGETGRTGG